jgi:hypothetical protein
LKPGRLDRRENNDPMTILVAVAVSAAIIWWLRDLTGELFTIATVAICLYQLLH